MLRKKGKEMININYDKCIGCLKCVDKCVCGAIFDNGGKPDFNRKYGCIKCFHCAAACSENAFLWGDKPAIINEEMPVIEETFGDDLKSFLMSKRSIRNFSDEIVPMELIKEALEIAAWAPSAKNQHPVKYVVMTEETIGKAMDIIVKTLEATGACPEILIGLKKGVNMVFAKAKTVIMAYCKANAINPLQDTALALDYASLYLHSKGVGSCWAGYLKDFASEIPELRELLGLPEGAKFHGCMLIGYPTEEYYYIPDRIKKADIQVK
ncbi:MAG: nitroreductase family protein [Lachnospiraceae bacterium]|nr:nitroreductase family protein [Lachnospiraceae bacterium]